MPYKDPEKRLEYGRKWRKENAEKDRERNRKWRQENAEKDRERKRKYRQENAEKERERNRKYYQENAEKVRERRRKYCHENAEKVREYNRKYNRKWRQENLEKKRVNDRRRRARKRNATVRGHKPTERKIEQLRMRFGWCCAACGKPLDDGIGHIDHFIPLAGGGKDAMWNLVPMCAKCNCSKNNSDPLEWLKRKRLVRKFARNLQQSGHWIAHPHFRHINENVGSPKEEREDGRSETSTKEQ